MRWRHMLSQMRAMRLIIAACLFFTGIEAAFGQDAAQMPNRCSSKTPISDLPGSAAWNGWGADASNTRFQSQPIQPDRLKLKWAFGFPGAKAVSGQPAVVAGRVFVSADNNYVYSLDSATGC